jgi:glycosyltransferase involved in cell wall biosynthesis
LVVTLHAIEADYLADLLHFRSIVHAVVVTNKLTAALVARQSGISPERILYAPYGVNIPDQLPPTPVRNAGLRIAWVGRFDQPQKRVHDIEAIIEHLDTLSCPYLLSIAGAGPEDSSMQQRLEPWIRQGSVRWLGRVDRDLLGNQIYLCNDVLLITSSWETGPIVAWEAMAAGMVVVSSHYVGSGLEGALVDGETALMFPVGNCEAAAMAICRLRDPHLINKLTKNSHEMVCHRYSSAASLAAWRDAFRVCEELSGVPLDIEEAARLGLCAPSGRVDRWIGVSRAETLRRLFGVGFRHSSPGSEWPHALHENVDNGSLLTLAARIETHA